MHNAAMEGRLTLPLRITRPSIETSPPVIIIAPALFWPSIHYNITESVTGTVTGTVARNGVTGTITDRNGCREHRNERVRNRPRNGSKILGAKKVEIVNANDYCIYQKPCCLYQHSINNSGQWHAERAPGALSPHKSSLLPARSSGCNSSRAAARGRRLGVAGIGLASGGHWAGGRAA